MMVRIHIHLWDTWAVNYIILLLYSYIRPVFTKKNQEKPPRNSGITLHTVVDSERTKLYKSRQIGDGG